MSSRRPNNPMPTVFVLQHEYEWCGHDKAKMIGVYATEADAQAAITRLREQPGFRDWPDGFTIDPYELGVDHWIEGFVTVVRILVPPKEESGNYQENAATWRPGDLYELGELDEPESTEFKQGDVVRVEERSVPGRGEWRLVVTARVHDGA